MASYKQYDVHGDEVTHHNLQDKTVWCKTGAKTEEVFVDIYGKELGVKINPDKTSNPYAPDLVTIENNLLGDLKTQNTPFFKAKSLYGIPPRFAVVFNQKDVVRYSEKYPEITIYFWVEWIPIKFVMGSFINEIEPLKGVWKISFKSLQSIIKNAPLHSYQQRKYDTKGNAKGSYVLDIRNELFEKVI